MQISNISSLNQALGKLKGCESLQPFFAEHNLAVCSKENSWEQNGACFSSIPMEFVGQKFNISFWNPRDQSPLAQAHKFLFLSPERILMLSRENGIDETWALGLIVKKMIGFFTPPLWDLFNRDTAQAKGGELSLFQYEEKRLSHDVQSGQKMWQLVQNCLPNWVGEEETLLNTEVSPSIGFSLMMKRLTGGLLTLHQEWLSHFARAYCDSHPQDTFSCDPNRFSRFFPESSEEQQVRKVANWLKGVKNGQAGYTDQTQQEILRAFNEFKKVIPRAQKVQQYLEATCSQEGQKVKSNARTQ